jgi:DNA repair exonuclease SbcCD nuclease subunit
MPTKTLNSDKIIGVLVSDLHLSSKPPSLRSKEKDWFVTMRLMLKQIKEIASLYKAFVICAGDVFDKWYSNPELVNFALEYLPTMYAVPGQHDLPYHDYNQLKRSAYYTLMKAGKIKNLDPNKPTLIKEHKIFLWGFPWGFEIKKIPQKIEKFVKKNPDYLNIAVTHQYIWIPGCNYEGAPQDKQPGTLKAKSYGYHVIHSGDNHSGFLVHHKLNKSIFFNSGVMMRRTREDMRHLPKLGLLRASGIVTSKEINIDQDVYLGVNEEEIDNTNIETKKFFQELSSLGGQELDFEKAIKKYVTIHGINKQIIKIIYEALEK